MKISGLKIYISRKIFWIFTFLIAFTILIGPYLFNQTFAQNISVTVHMVYCGGKDCGSSGSTAGVGKDNWWVMVTPRGYSSQSAFYSDCEKLASTMIKADYFSDSARLSKTYIGCFYEQTINDLRNFNAYTNSNSVYDALYKVTTTKSHIVLYTGSTLSEVPSDDAGNINCTKSDNKPANMSVVQFKSTSISSQVVVTHTMGHMFCLIDEYTATDFAPIAQGTLETLEKNGNNNVNCKSTKDGFGNGIVGIAGCAYSNYFRSKDCSVMYANCGSNSENTKFSDYQKKILDLNFNYLAGIDGGIFHQGGSVSTTSSSGSGGSNTATTSSNNSSTGRQFPVMVKTGTIASAIAGDYIYAWFTDGFLGYQAGNDPSQAVVDSKLPGVVATVSGKTGHKMFMVSDKDTLAKVMDNEKRNGLLKKAGIEFIGYDMEISPPGTEQEEMNARQNTNDTNSVAIAAKLAKDNGFKLVWGSIFANTVNINDDAMKVMLKAGLWGIAFQAQNQWDNPNGGAASQIVTAVNRYRKDADAVGAAYPHITVQIMTDGSNCISGQGTVPMASCQGLVQGLIKAGYMNSLSVWAQGATITEAFLKQILEGYYTSTPPATGGGSISSSASSGSANSGNNSNPSSTVTTSEPNKPPPADNVAINGGQPTISCKLGVSTEKTFPADGFTTVNAERLVDRGLNPGWIMTGIDMAAVKSLSDGVMIKKLADNGTNTILIPCPLADSCDIQDGAAYADALWDIATKVGRPFWAKAAHSFAKTNYGGDDAIQKEAKFITDLLKELKTKMKAQADQSDIGQSLKFRGYINLLTPELTYKSPFHTDPITPEEYLAKLLAADDAEISMGEFKGMLFDVVSPDAMSRAIELSKQYNLQVYALVGIDNASSIPFTDAQAKLVQQLAVNQYLHSANVAAIIIQNGYTMGANQARTEPIDAYNLWKKLGNNDLTRYPWLSSSQHACDYLKKIPDPNKAGSYLLPQSCGEMGILGDRTEPTSVNTDIPYLFESQIISMLDAAGCSNTFTMQCTNENNLREKETGDLIFLSNDKSTPLRRIYDETRLATVTPTLTTKVTGYMDFPDKTIKTSDYTFTYCTNVPCTPANEIVEIWTNVVSDVTFKTDVLTTAEVNFPQLRSLGSLDANGTDDANFPTFPALANRAGTTSGLKNDYGRVADGEVYFSFSGGLKMSFPIPMLGSTQDLYTLDQLNTKLTNPAQTKTPGYTYLIDPDRIEKVKTFIPETYASKFVDSQPSFVIDGKKVPFTTKAERPQVVDENYSNKGMYQYPGNGLMSLNKVTTSVNNYPNGNTKVSDLKDSTQFNASEVTTGEGSIQVQNQDEAGMQEISLLDFAKASPPVDNIASGEISWAVDSLNGKDCSDSTVPNATHTVNGRPMAHSGEMPAFHLGKVGAGVACNDFPKRILGSNESITQAGDPNTMGSLAYKMYGSVSDPATIEFHPLKRVAFNGSAVSGAAGALKILRTSWLFSQRFHSEVLDSYKAANPSDELQICHNMEVDTTLTSYSRFYSVSNTISSNYPKPVTVDSQKGDASTFYCMNPKNEARSGNKLPMVFLNSDADHAAVSTSVLPWLGTAQAIFEDVAKRQFNSSVTLPDKCKDPTHAPDSDCLAIPRCGPGAEKSVTCLCKPSEVQYKKLEIFLCQNGMMDYSEMVDQGLIHPEFQSSAPEKFNPQGCLFVFNNKNAPNSTTSATSGGTTTPTPTTPGYTYGDGNKFMGVYGWKRMQTASSQGKVDLVSNFINSFGKYVDSDTSKIIGVLNVNIGTTTGGSCPFSSAGVGTMSVATAQSLATLAAAKHYIIMFDIQPGTCSSDTIKNVMKTYYVNNNINFDFDLEWVKSITITQLNAYVDYYYNTLKGAVPFIGIYYFSPNHLVTGGTASPHLATINDGIGSCAAKETSILAQLKNFGKVVTSPDKPGLWGGMDFSVGGYDSCAPSVLFPWIIKNGGTIFMSQQ